MKTMVKHWIVLTITAAALSSVCFWRNIRDEGFFSAYHPDSERHWSTGLTSYRDEPHLTFAKDDDDDYFSVSCEATPTKQLRFYVGRFRDLPSNTAIMKSNGNEIKLSYSRADSFTTNKNSEKKYGNFVSPYTLELFTVLDSERELSFEFMIIGGSLIRRYPRSDIGECVRAFHRDCLSYFSGTLDNRMLNVGQPCTRQR